MVYLAEYDDIDIVEKAAECFLSVIRAIAQGYLTN